MDITLLDRIVAVAGFLITIWQLRKTRSAAMAAKLASVEAVAAVRRLEATTQMHDIVSRSRELQRILRSSSFAVAAAAAFELRDAVARYRQHPTSGRAPAAADWNRLSEDVTAVHDRVESLSIMRKASKEDRESVLTEVSRLHSAFVRFAVMAADGVVNAHT